MYLILLNVFAWLVMYLSLFLPGVTDFKAVKDSSTSDLSPPPSINLLVITASAGGFFVFCILFGVFNRHFRNGGVQLLSFGVVNFYVYLLVILHWPVRTNINDSNLNDSEVVGLADEAPARRNE